ncbi:MAG: ABC transporter permease [Nocardioides sp.]|nr:ABC transporter permease [Nocardioides sp.]
MTTLESARPDPEEWELASPAPKGGLAEVFRRRYLLKLVVKRQLAQQYSASVLGFIWSYIQPLIRFLVYYFAVAMVLKAHVDTPHFAIHLFCGLIMVHFFNQTIGAGTRSIWSNRRLVKKMALPREVFPVASVMVAAFHTLPQVIILAIATGIIGFAVDLTGILAGVLALTLITVFGAACALFFSAANVFFRDFQNLIGTITGFMHFMVPMIYSYDRIADSAIGGTVWEEVYLANPVATGVLLLQRCFWSGVVDDPSATLYPDHLMLRGVIMLAVSLVLLVLAQLTFRRLETKFPERL